MVSKKSFTPAQKKAFRQKAKERTQAVIQETAQGLLDMISDGKNKKWHKTYALNPAYGPPHNPVSKHFFSGLNQIILLIDMVSNDRQDARYCTYNQAKKMAKDSYVSGPGAVTLLRPIFIDNDKLEEDELEHLNREPDENDKILVGYSSFQVHSAENIAGVPAPEDFFQEVSWETDDRIDRFIEASGIEVRHGTNQAAYSIARDYIRMPDKAAFDNPADYYADLLHEFYHATGHSSRENRFEGERTPQDNALEELRAEIFSAMVGNFFGLKYKKELTADYLKFWNEKAEKDPRELIRQANKASNILQDVILFNQGQQPKSKWFPKVNHPAPELVDEIESLVVEPQDQAPPWEQFTEDFETPFVDMVTEGKLVFVGGHSTDGVDPDAAKEAFRIKTAIEEKLGNTVTLDVVNSERNGESMTHIEISIPLSSIQKTEEFDPEPIGMAMAG